MNRDIKLKTTAGANADLLRSTRAKPSVTSEWQPINPPAIEGVSVREVKSVVASSGVVTELYRSEWFGDELSVVHAVHVSLLPGGISQWHCHQQQRDVIFPVCGQLRVGLYDGRDGSPTVGESCVLHFNPMRPRYLHVPPGVWHALKNIGAQDAAYVVLNDQPYVYDNPDDWVLAPNSPKIPVTL